MSHYWVIFVLELSDQQGHFAALSDLMQLDPFASESSALIGPQRTPPSIEEFINRDETNKLAGDQCPFRVLAPTLNRLPCSNKSESLLRAYTQQMEEEMKLRGKTTHSRKSKFDE